ncbi:MAG: hypothetical protein AMXMBFR83_31160 [Phycisphaerae bacterium]
MWTCVVSGWLATVAAAQPVLEPLAPGGPTSQPAGAPPPPAIISPASRPSESEQAALARARPAIAAERYEEAAAILEPLAESGGATFDVLINLGGAHDALALKALTAIADTPEAKQETKARYETHRKKAVEYYLRAGYIALRSLDPRAESIFKQVLWYDPGRPEALRSLAVLSQKANSVYAALHYYEQYCDTAQGKTDYEAQVLYGGLLVNIGMWRLGITVLDKVKEVGGTRAKRELARAYLAGNQPEKALAVITEAIARDQNDSEAYMIRAGLILSTGGARTFEAVNDALKSMRLAQRDVAARPEDDAVWGTLAETRDNCEQIITVLNAKAAAGQLDTLSAIGMSELLMELGTANKLRYDYDSAVLLSLVGRAENADLDVLTALLGRLKALKRAADVRRTAERILQRDPNNPVAREALEQTRPAGTAPAGG